MKVESTDGVTVVVHDLGGGGEPFLICHATGMHGRAYQQMAEELSARHHVWALDFRGHGDTEPPANGRFHWDGMADDLDATINELTSDPISVFGHSMGGAAAILVERRRPGTLRAAYLFEPIVQPMEMHVPPGHNPMGAIARRRRRSFPSKADALLRYASRAPLNVWQAGALADYVQHGFVDASDGTVQLKCDPEHEAATFEADGKPTIEMATEVQTPTTVAMGALDTEWSPAAFARPLAEAMPNAILEQHPTLGHFGPLQDPALIAEAIVARV